MFCRNSCIPVEFQGKLCHASVFTSLTSPSETCEVGCIRRLEVLRTKSPQHCELPLIRSPALEQSWWFRCSGDRVPCIAQLPAHRSVQGLRLVKARDFSHQLLQSAHKFDLSSSPTGFLFYSAIICTWRSSFIASTGISQINLFYFGRKFLKLFLISFVKNSFFSFLSHSVGFFTVCLVWKWAGVPCATEVTYKPWFAFTCLGSFQLSWSYSSRDDPGLTRYPTCLCPVYCGPF